MALVGGLSFEWGFGGVLLTWGVAVLGRAYRGLLDGEVSCAGQGVEGELFVLTALMVEGWGASK